MNQVIVSLPRNSFEFSQNSDAIFVITTPLSAPEFDAVLHDAINDYLEGWKSFEPAVQSKLAAVQECEFESPEHEAATAVFHEEFVKQQAFGDANKVFEHEGHKLLLTDFIENESTPEVFSVMSLADWLAMKHEESTTGFKTP